MANMTISLNDDEKKAGNALTVEIPDRIVDYDVAKEEFGKESADASFKQGSVVRFQTACRRKCKDNWTVEAIEAFAQEWKPGAGRTVLTEEERLAKIGYSDAQIARMLAAAEEEEGGKAKPAKKKASKK